jgi:RNA-binding protein
MYELSLTGAQKSFLRGLGQRLEPSLKVGKEGLSLAFFVELQRLLRSNELVKLRFVGATERAERTTWCEQIADEGRCVCVGAVGHTALFYRQHPEPEQRAITLPEK